MSTNENRSVASGQVVREETTRSQYNARDAFPATCIHSSATVAIPAGQSSWTLGHLSEAARSRSALLAFELRDRASHSPHALYIMYLTSADSRLLKETSTNGGIYVLRPR